MVDLTASQKKQLATYKDRLARVKRDEVWASKDFTALPLQSNVGIARHSCSALKAGLQAASSQTIL
jgi:hypothetical protein